MAIDEVIEFPKLPWGTEKHLRTARNEPLEADHSAAAAQLRVFRGGFSAT